MQRAWRLAIVVAFAIAANACSQASAPGTNAPETRATPPAGAAASSPGAAAAPAAEPQTVADIFPPGPGRDQVLNNCASCHNVACSAIGQRPPERWDSLKESHKERLPGPDLDVIFTYLKANFDNSKPEPKVPPKFLEGGCTPF